MPDSELKKLQRVQIFAAKVVLQRKKSSSSTQALKELHWLPIHLRISYKICVLVFKCRSNEAPIYLQELLIPKIQRREGLRSVSTNNLDFEVPYCPRKTLKERSFSVQGPKCWNALPNLLKEVASVDAFKKGLKTYYFNKF